MSITSVAAPVTSASQWSQHGLPGQRIYDEYLLSDADCTAIFTALVVAARSIRDRQLVAIARNIRYQQETNRGQAWKAAQWRSQHPNTTPSEGFFLLLREIGEEREAKEALMEASND